MWGSPYSYTSRRARREVFRPCLPSFERWDEKSPPSSPGSFPSRTPTGLPFPHGGACFNRSVSSNKKTLRETNLSAQTSKQWVSALPPSSRLIAPSSTNSLQLGLARNQLRTHFSPSVWSGRRSRRTPHFLFRKGGTSSRRPTASFRLQPMSTNYYHSSVNAISPLPPSRIPLCNYRTTVHGASPIA